MDVGKVTVEYMEAQKKKVDEYQRLQEKFDDAEDYIGLGFEGKDANSLENLELQRELEQEAEETGEQEFPRAARGTIQIQP